MDFNILPFYYEATGGQRYRKGGVPDSSIFTEEAIEYIREFESAVLNFESFQRLNLRHSCCDYDVCSCSLFASKSNETVY